METFAPENQAARRKELGAFYTPPEMAAQLVRWAVRDASATVLDPSFGGLAFLTAAHERLCALGASKQQARTQIFGGELDDTAYDAGQRDSGVGASVRRLVRGDFLSFVPGEDLPVVDAVVGNPPYVRYQGFNGGGTLGHDLAERAGVRLTRLASSWAPFVVHGTAFLKEGGRMAQVLPAEILHAQYAEDVLGFLRRSFAAVTLVLFEERVFPGALEEVVLLLAERRGVGPADDVHVIQHADLAALNVDRLAARRPSAERPPSVPGDSLLAQLLPDETRRLYGDLQRHVDVGSLGALASVDIGAVTGANDFFVVAASDARVPERFLRPAVSKAAHIPGARLTAEDHRRLTATGKPTRMLVVDRDHQVDDLADLEPYLAIGQALGINERYKCRVRSPWWSVPVPKHGAPDALMTYCSSEHPRLVVNEAGVLHTNTVHGLTMHGGMSAGELAARFLNSMTLLSAELAGRSYGGGVLKLEPTEAEAVLIPGGVAAVAERLAEIDVLLRTSGLTAVLDLVDPLVLDGLGLSTEEIALLRAAAEQLRARRRSRGKAPRPAAQLTL